VPPIDVSLTPKIFPNASSSYKIGQLFKKSIVSKTLLSIGDFFGKSSKITRKA